jgi:hypothetical protein
LIDEERLVNVEAKTLKLILTQLSKREEEPTPRVVCPKVDQLVWDRPLQPPNTNTLMIYLKFVSTFHDHLGRFDECLVENDDVHLFSRTWFLMINIIVG